MKPLIVLILAGAWGAAAGSEQLAAVQKVYLMPMTAGLDQHLADQLSRQGVFTVVVDPKQADAVWSDRVDAGFFESLNELYAAGKEGETKKDESLEGDAAKPPARRTWNRTRGTVFVVGVASRQVLWSNFREIEDASPKGLQRIAERIVKDLRRDLKKE
jgi:hypothetical protein